VGWGEGIEDENKGPFKLPDRAPVFFENRDAHQGDVKIAIA
jgi:hypothetical protein